MKKFRISFAYPTTELASRFHVLGTHSDFRIFGKKAVIETNSLEDIQSVLSASKTLFDSIPVYLTIHVINF